jgi:glucose-6-phosphate dehydrogenase assembly protein OpcA
MIVDLPTTNSSKINKALVDIRDKGGSGALGRVLTLVIVTDEAESEDPIAAANAASFEHPCRVIVVARGARRASPRMDAQIRVGGDAGASEVVVLRLYGSLVDHGASVVVPLLLADAPVVVWWPGDAPEVPAEDPIGRLAQRRITDAAASRRPLTQLAKRRDTYRPGDTDFSWTRLTRWRGLLASTLDQPPHDKVTGASVAGSADSPSADLFAGWLALTLKVPVKRIKSPAKAGPGVHSVVLNRRAGDISLIRPQTITAELKVANQPERHVALPRRGLRDCLSEELRRLDADDVYADVLSKGLALVAKYAATEPKAATARGPRSAGSGVAGSAASRKSASEGSKAPATKPRTRSAARSGVAPDAAQIAAATASVDDPVSADDNGSSTAAAAPPTATSAPPTAMQASASAQESPNGGRPARQTRSTGAAPRAAKASTARPGTAGPGRRPSAPGTAGLS